MASQKASRTAKPSKEIPDKPYFKIGEVAALAGVAPSVLRFWETEFRGLKPEKTKTNQRVYTRKHAELVLTIRELLYDRGFTIAGARQKLRESPRGAADGKPQDKNDGKAGRPSEAIENLKKEVQELLRLLDE
jgi:DNA-binding transcriptional MerR regulator